MVLFREHIAYQLRVPARSDQKYTELKPGCEKDPEAKNMG
jgi:hypothetical protein